MKAFIKSIPLLLPIALHSHSYSMDEPIPQDQGKGTELSAVTPASPFEDEQKRWKIEVNKNDIWNKHRIKPKLLHLDLFGDTNDRNNFHITDDFYINNSSKGFYRDDFFIYNEINFLDSTKHQLDSFLNMRLAKYNDKKSDYMTISNEKDGWFLEIDSDEGIFTKMQNRLESQSAPNYGNPKIADYKRIRHVDFNRNRVVDRVIPYAVRTCGTPENTNNEQIRKINFKCIAARYEDRKCFNKILKAYLDEKVISYYVIEELIKYLNNLDKEKHKKYEISFGLSYSDLGCYFYKMTLNFERLLESIEKRLDPNSTNEQFKSIIFSELDNLNNPDFTFHGPVKDYYKERRQTLNWELIQHLISKGNFSQDIHMSLLKEISSTDLPFYPESRKMLSDLMLLDGQLSQKSVKEKYEPCVLTLLNVANNPSIQSNLKTLVQDFLNNDNQTQDPLPAALENITVSPETIFELMNIIREQNLKISRLVVK